MIEVAVEPEVIREADLCPACGSASMRTLFHGTDRLFATTANYFEVVECTECRLMRLFPQPTAAELNRYYPPNYWFAPGTDAASRAEDFYRRLVLGDHVRFVERAIDSTKAPGPLLDVGCGGGLFLRLLRERGHKVVGLDFSIEAAHTAWSVNRVPAMCGTLSKAPLRTATFSIITMFHVLEHLYDPVGYVEEAHKLLAADGRLVIQVPNAASWQFLLFGQNWNGIDIPRHLVNFKEKDIVALLESCGFEILRRKFFSLRDNPAGMATSISAALDPMSRRVRKVPETPAIRLLKDGIYFGLTLLCLPFTLIEAACRAGSTIMIEARKKMIVGLLPGPLRRYVLDFETRIERAVTAFAAALPPGTRVLDAGAGEGAYRSHFAKQQYIGLDLGIGDQKWNYGELDVLGDLASLPFPNGAFDAAINIVTLEHVKDPRRVLSELARVLKPGAKLLLVVPHEWEVHQHPHDFFRFTRFGVEALAREAGLQVISIEPGGGYFRLLSRRLLGGAQFFPVPLNILWLVAVAPTALLLPLLDRIDEKKDFTLGYLAVLENGRK